MFVSLSLHVWLNSIRLSFDRWATRLYCNSVMVACWCNLQYGSNVIHWSSPRKGSTNICSSVYGHVHGMICYAKSRTCPHDALVQPVCFLLQPTRSLWEFFSAQLYRKFSSVNQIKSTPYLEYFFSIFEWSTRAFFCTFKFHKVV